MTRRGVRRLVLHGLSLLDRLPDRRGPARARASSVVHGVTAATAEVLGRLRGVLVALAAVALAGAALGVTAAMTATVLERRLEAGLLVALGAPRGRVVPASSSARRRCWASLGGLAGGAAGPRRPAACWASGVLGVAVPAAPVLLPFAALLGLLLAVLASLPPVLRALWRATRRAPEEGRRLMLLRLVLGAASAAASASSR